MTGHRHVADLACEQWGKDHPGMFAALNTTRAVTGRPGGNILGCWACTVLAMIAMNGGSFDTPNLADHYVDGCVLATLAAWRLAKGVYRFDPDLLDELLKTPPSKEVTGEDFAHFPEWAIYVETPGFNVGTSDDPNHWRVPGFWARLEPYVGADVTAPRPGICIAILGEDINRQYVLPIMIPFGKTVEEMLDALEEDQKATFVPLIKDLLGLLLYIITQSGDVTKARRAEAKPVKGGTRKWFVSEQVQVRDVGIVLGPALRSAKALSEAKRSSIVHGGERAPQRPHIRSAHWHTVLSGPRTEDRIREVRWFPPVFVGLSDEELPVVLRRVKR